MPTSDEQQTPSTSVRDQEVDDHVQAGRVTTFDSETEFVAYLDELAAEAEQAESTARRTQKVEHRPSSRR